MASADPDQIGALFECGLTDNTAYRSEPQLDIELRTGNRL
jgi:hypothetical protein